MPFMHSLMPSFIHTSPNECRKSLIHYLVECQSYSIKWLAAMLTWTTLWCFFVSFFSLFCPFLSLFWLTSTLTSKPACYLSKFPNELCSRHTDNVILWRSHGSLQGVAWFWRQSWKSTIMQPKPLTRHYHTLAQVWEAHWYSTDYDNKMWYDGRQMQAVYKMHDWGWAQTRCTPQQGFQCRTNQRGKWE